MNTAVFSEGKNDLYFLQELFDRITTDYELEEFKAEDYKDLPAIRQAESEKLESFFEDYSPYDVFIKSEEGGLKLRRVFSGFVDYVLKNCGDAFLLIDVDDRDTVQISDDVIGRIESRFEGPGLTVNRNCEVYSNEYFRVLSHDVRRNTQRVGQFYIVGVRPDLESLAGIDYTEDEDELREKLGEFLEEPRVKACFQDIMGVNFSDD